MKPIKNFNDFLKEGIVKKQSPDLSRANFLIKESQKSYFFINSLVKDLGLNDDNANSIIKLCYDIIMGFIRAKMLKDGYNAVGQGAHEAEVSYLRSIGFNENDVQFANQLRYFRNGIMYYGKMFDKEYAKQVLDFLNKIINKLK
ncbi:MAG: hypothetical protein AABW57_00555 [Nanoarchaeota archaeon]